MKKKLLSIVISVLLITTMSSIAFTTNVGAVDGLTTDGFDIIYLDSDRKTCAITGVSSLHENDTHIDIPQTVDNGNTTVVAINRSAFANLHDLTSVTFPNTLKTIGPFAFYKTGLKSVTIPNTVEQIGEEAFSNCPNLKTVTVSTGINEKSTAAFALNPNLEYINIGEGIEVIPENFANGCLKLKEVILPDSVTTLKENAFYDCPSIKHVETGDGLTSLNGFDFSRATFSDTSGKGTGLVSIIIGDSVTKINQCQFANCTNLTEVELGAKVNSIGDYAFYNCPLEAEIKIPDTVTTIYDHVFGGSENIKKLTTGKGITSYNYLSFAQIPNLETVVIADGTTTLSDGVFINNESLKEIYIPKSVTTIESGAITGFSNLTVYGYKGTAAEAFAKGHIGVTFVTLDDKTSSECTVVAEVGSDIDIVDNTTNKPLTNDKIAYNGLATATYTGSDEIIGWKINDKVVSVTGTQTYSFYVTEDSIVKPILYGETLEPAYISVGTTSYTIGKTDEVRRIYFPITATGYEGNPNVQYGVIRSTNSADVTEKAVKTYIDTKESNSYIKDYTETNVMNSDGRYNYVAVAPAQTDKTLHMQAWISIDGEVYMSDTVEVKPSDIFI